MDKANTKKQFYYKVAHADNKMLKENKTIQNIACSTVLSLRSYKRANMLTAN